MTRHHRSTIVAGVVGSPVAPFAEPADPQRLDRRRRDRRGLCRPSPGAGRLRAPSSGLRGGVMRGLNVTLPFKEQALGAGRRRQRRGRARPARPTCCCSTPTGRSRPTTPTAGPAGRLRRAGAGFDPAAGPVVILGRGRRGAGRGGGLARRRRAGGADRQPHGRSKARGAGATLGRRVAALWSGRRRRRSTDAAPMINATSLGLGGGDGPRARLSARCPAARW